MNEINQQQLLLNEIDKDVCQYHFDLETPRLGMICRNSIKFEYCGPGLIMEQARVRNDQTIVQTNQYRFTLIDNRSFEIENVYVVPDANAKNSRFVGKYFDNQGNSSKMYAAGGDFNLDWKKCTSRNALNVRSMTQMITEPTRIAEFMRNGRLYSPKKILDLIFTNSNFKAKVLKTEIYNTSDLPFFDHFGVVMDLSFPKNIPYRDVIIPRDPLRRNRIDSETYDKIKQDHDRIWADQDYDSYWAEVRRVLDMHVPMNPTRGVYRKRIFDVPYSKELRDEIKLKHKLSFDSRMNKSNLVLAELARKQRNKVTKLTQNFKKEYAAKKLVNQTTPNGLEKTIQFLEQRKSATITHPEPLIINGYYGQSLVEDLSKYFKGRAEDLVDTKDIENSPGLQGVIKDDEKPIIQLKLDHFPKIEKIENVIPANKTTRTSGMDGISSEIIVKIFPIIKEKLNKILTSSLKFPKFCQGYYQRTISKSATKRPTVREDMRPLGINNPIPKYLMSKFVWTKIRDHLKALFKKRNIMTYAGCTLAIILTLDAAIIQVNLGFKVIIQKFDFSNAFGTLFLPRLMEVFEQLNVCEKTIEFVRDYFTNQAFCQTVCHDGIHGIHISKPTLMLKGGAQGQCGMDVAFTVQQLALSPGEDVRRIPYMDDLNDIISNSKTAKEAITKAKNNDDRLTEQSTRVGFAKNVSKTTYIPINITKEEVIKEGNIDKKYVLTNTGILGCNFRVENSRFDMGPAANDVIQSMHANYDTIRQSQYYVADHHDRCKIARRIVYSFLGKISLIYAYGFKQTRNEAFDRVQVAVNHLFRATGLRASTPQWALDKCFGTSLEKFATQCVIIDGFKLVEHLNLTDLYDRTNKIRPRGVFAQTGTFSEFFAIKFNGLDTETRLKLIDVDKKITDSKKKTESMKSYLKSLRKLDFDETIHTNYYWISLGNDNNP